MRALAWLYLLLFAFGLLPASLDAARLQVVEAGQRFTRTPVAVWDVDWAVWCAEGPKIRIAGVAAREMDGSCKINQPCPDVDPKEARDRLVSILGGGRGTLPTGHVKVRSAPMSCARTRPRAWRANSSAGVLISGQNSRRAPRGNQVLDAVIDLGPNGKYGWIDQSTGTGNRGSNVRIRGGRSVDRDVLILYGGGSVNGAAPGR